MQDLRELLGQRLLPLQVLGGVVVRLAGQSSQQAVQRRLCGRARETDSASSIIYSCTTTSLEQQNVINYHKQQQQQLTGHVTLIGSFEIQQFKSIMKIKTLVSAETEVCCASQ